MRTIPIAALPNQTLTVNIDLTRFVLTLKMARGVLMADVAINGVTVLRGVRVLAGEMIIPYRYKEFGNFILTTVDDALPEWAELGRTQLLFYFTPDEMGAIRGDN